MAAPIVLAPATLKALQWGAAAAVVLYAAHRRGRAATDLTRDAALDDVEDGVSVDTSRRPGEARADAAGRWRRTIRVGRDGPGVEIDLAGIGRATVKTVKGRR